MKELEIARLVVENEQIRHILEEGVSGDVAIESAWSVLDGNGVGEWMKEQYQISVEEINTKLTKENLNLRQGLMTAIEKAAPTAT